jgi:DNA mismatch repair protein MutS
MDQTPSAGPVRKVKSGRALQSSLFAALPDPMLNELRRVDPEALALEQALDLIRRLRDLAGS